MSKEPYIITEIVQIVRSYNPEYGDDRICECGHTYKRHFDSYEDMDAVGCKYCACYEFVEIEDGKDSIADAENRGYLDGKNGLTYFNPYSQYGNDERWHDAYKTRYQWGIDTRRDLEND